jgi:SAM-dependent methyltransferase
MANNENRKSYLEKLKKTAKQALAEPRVREYMSSLFDVDIDNTPIGGLIDHLDQSMRDYADNWSIMSGKHEESGLYKRISEFAGAKSGVYVDLACGAGNLLCALPKNMKLIGADINPYILQRAQENLRQAGKKTETHSDIRMGFLPGTGFVVRPEPLIEKLDLRKVQLISDDINDMGNTMRTLYYQGIKADGAFFTLAGGHSVQRSAEIITAVRYHHTGKDHGEVKSLSDILGDVLRNTPFVVKKNGRLYLAMRGTAMNDAGEVGGISVEPFIRENYNDSLEVVREETVPMIDERGSKLVSITSHPDMDEEEVEKIPEDVKKSLKKLPYKLSLCEVRVK